MWHSRSPVRRGGRARRAGGAALAGMAVAACSGEPQAPPLPPPIPVVESALVGPGPSNVLSAVVRASLLGTDSVAVRFGPAGQGLDSLTPVFPLSADTVELPVLGLLPETDYRFQVVAYGEGGPATSDTLRLTTGMLPADLPSYSAGGSAPSPGFVVFSAYPYTVVIDNSGRVVWYRHLDGGPTLNFQAQPTGRYTTSPIQPDSTDAAPWVEFDPLGRETRRMGCAAGLKSRFHEMLVEDDGGWWVMCDEIRVMDLTALGGRPDAQVTGTVVQHVGADGALLFAWNPFDHFAITDLDAASLTGPSVNWTHGNALAFDTDGGLLISFRSLNEITKVDPVTGEVRWRLGGLRNQFAISGAPGPFVGQHGLRVIGPGMLQFLDNRGVTGDSRAVRYQLDETNRTAQFVAEFHSLPPVSALLGGSTQLLPAGRLLVAYGNANRVQEYDASGAVVWEIHGNPGYVFRAQRIVSLYQPGVGTSR
jgi:hypothetical protein